ncbi:folate transporter 1, putative [Plasmodium ovale]|uniref:Folate transporter 1, putative n=1 Tax=Plasmodium ovale TaxID=36330 RepID=A0A1C3KP00_PLAOA|nr:folate transporter 1, putative [Plasmodium ovale]
MEKEEFYWTDKRESYETCSTLTIASYNSLNEKSYLIGNVVKDEDCNTDIVCNKICPSLVAMLQGVEVLCNFSILYLLKDNYKLHPASLNVVMSFIKIPWSIKLLWGVASDSYPIFGYRRKYYLILGSFLCMLSLIILGLINHGNIILTVIFLTIYFFGSSLCSVIGEAQVVESSRKGNINTLKKNVSLFLIFRKISFSIMSYLSGYLLSYMTKQHIFLIASILPFLIFISSFFIVEKKNYEIYGIKKKIKSIFKIIKISYIKNLIIFMFIMMSIPSNENTLFFYMTNELHFSSNTLGKIAMYQSLASLMAILFYISFFSKINIIRLLLYSTIFTIPFFLFPLIIMNKLKFYFYISNNIFIIIYTILIEFINEFQTIPILIQCYITLPDAFESTTDAFESTTDDSKSTIYSLLLSVNNLAIIFSSFISSVLTYILQITATNFENLFLLIIICCITNFIPIFFLYIIPGFNSNTWNIKYREDNDYNKSQS